MFHFVRIYDSYKYLPNYFKKTFFVNSDGSKFFLLDIHLHRLLSTSLMVTNTYGTCSHFIFS